MKTDPTVFLVDDDDAVRASISRFLIASGLHVRSFASAREFLADSVLDCPGCLLLDLRMPEIDGLELQEALSESARLVLPVVIVLGLALLVGDPAHRQDLRRMHDCRVQAGLLRLVHLVAVFGAGAVRQACSRDETPHRVARMIEGRQQRPIGPVASDHGTRVLPSIHEFDAAFQP